MKDKNKMDTYFNTLIENFDLGFAIFEPKFENNEIVNFKCIEMNDYGLKALGTNKENVIGNILTNFDATLQINIFFNYLKEAFLASHKINTRCHFSKKDNPNSITHFDLTFYKLENKLFALFRDITKNKDTELALEKSQDRYKILVKSIFEYLYTTEFSNGEIISQFHSPQCETITGYTANEYQNDTYLWYKMIHSEDRWRVLEYVEKRKFDPNLNMIEHRIIHKNGQVKWISDHASLKYNSNGEIVRIDGVISDITEKKLNEILVKESEQRHRILFSTAIEGILFVDFYGNIIDANPSVAKMLECDLEELKTKNFSLFLKPDPRNLALLKLDKACTDYETMIISKNSNHFFATINSVPLKIGNNNRALVVLRDTTERREFEKTLEESEHKYRTIFETSPYGMIIVRSDDYLVITSNNKFIQLVNLDINDVINQYLFSLSFWGSEENKFLFKDVLETAGEIDNFQSVFITKNSSCLNCILSAKKIRYDKYDAFYINVHNVTEILKTKEQLLLLNNAIHQIAEAVLITNLNGDLLYTNKAFNNLFNFENVSLDKKFPEIFQPVSQSDDIYKEIWDTLLKGNIWDGEIIKQVTDNEHIILELSITPIKNNENKISYFITLLKDITDFRKISQEKESLLAQLFQIQKMESIGRLASGVAHDFNNMLGIIMTTAELIRDISTNSEINSLCENIETTCKQTSNLVKQLLLFSKSTSLNKATIDFNKLLSKTVKMLKHSLGKNIDIELSLHPSSSYIDADEIQIQQIILNLAINAKDAMPEGGSLKFTTTNVYLDKEFCRTKTTLTPGHYVEIIVEDSGIGIPPAMISQIFEPFVTTKAKHGTGLGLSVVYGIISSHNAYIEIDTQVKKGTKFQLYFPLSINQVKVIESTNEELSHKGNESVLIIDDEEMLLKSMNMGLTSLGYTIFTATNGTNGIELYKNNDINLVILDILIPKINGLEIYKGLSQLNPDIKILFTSGIAEESFIKDSGFINEDNFLKKPFSINALSAKIRKILY
jgi:PAS domain S-box-containing protein